MKLRNERNAQMLAEAAHTELTEYQDKLIAAIINTDIAEINDMIYGAKFKDFNNNYSTLDEISEALKQSGIATPRYEHFEALMNVVFMGDGECPNCGDDYEEIDTTITRVETYGGEYEPEYHGEITKRCRTCGEIITEYF